MFVPFGVGSLEDFVAVLVFEFPLGDERYIFTCPVEFALRVERAEANAFLVVASERSPWSLFFQRSHCSFLQELPLVPGELAIAIQSSVEGLEALLESAGGLERVYQLEDAARRASRTNQAFADWVLFGSAKPLVFLRAPGGVAVYA